MIVIGERYGKLIPIEKLNKANKSDFWYLCKCDCGNTKIVRGTNLKSGHVKSCGCIRSRKNTYSFSDDVCSGYDENGNKFLIDSEDYEKIKKYYWRYEKRTGYFQSFINGHSLYLHRYLMNVKSQSGICVDHINRDKTDNRKSNLRLCTSHQNTMNKLSPHQISGKYRGVQKVKSKYSAAITYKYKRYHLGYFFTAEEAAKAYNEKAKELYGEFAVLNEYPF
jgi:hypothetical protein